MRTARCLGPLLMLAVLPAFQGTDRPNADRPDRDPPGRVGRLSFVTGSVSFRPGDVDDWVAATVNYPLHDGDHLWTDNDARAEIRRPSSWGATRPPTTYTTRCGRTTGKTGAPHETAAGKIHARPATCRTA